MSEFGNNDAKGQTTITKWTKKRELLNEYQMKEGFKLEYSAREADRKGCTWCERFLNAGFRFCINCGSPVK